MSLQRNLRNRFAPRVEALEDRLVPALTVNHLGTSLTITAMGNTQLNHNHSVTILDDGKGDFTVTIDGSTTSFSGVTSLTFFGGNKADHVVYELTGDLQQTETLAFHLRQGNDTFSGLLLGNIGHTSGGTTTNGALNLSVDHGPGNDVASLVDLGKVLSGSSLNYTENFGGNATGVANRVASTVLIEGDVAGTASFDFTTGQSNAFANRETLNFVQLGNITGSGVETVTAHGTTRSPGFIHDTFDFNGQLKGTLVVSEQAGTTSTSRAFNTLDEEITLNSGSNGSLFPMENNQPRSKGTETLNVFKSGSPTVVGTIDQAFPGSTATTNDPADVTITKTM
jgi:hypothetical protein